MNINVLCFCITSVLAVLGNPSNVGYVHEGPESVPEHVLDSHHMVSHMIHLADLHEEYEMRKGRVDAEWHRASEEEKNFLRNHLDEVEQLMVEVEEHLVSRSELHHADITSHLNPLSRDDLMRLVEHLEKAYPQLATQTYHLSNHEVGEVHGSPTDRSMRDQFLKEVLGFLGLGSKVQDMTPTVLQRDHQAAKDLHHVVEHLLHLAQLYEEHNDVEMEYREAQENADEAAMEEDLLYLEDNLAELEEMMEEVEGHVDGDDHSHHSGLIKILEPLDVDALTTVLEHLERSHGHLHYNMHSFDSFDHKDHHSAGEVHKTDHKHTNKYVVGLLKQLRVGEFRPESREEDMARNKQQEAQLNMIKETPDAARAAEIHHILEHLLELDHLYDKYHAAEEDMDYFQYEDAFNEEVHALAGELGTMEQMIEELEDHIDGDDHGHHSHYLDVLNPFERDELKRVMTHLEQNYRFLRPDSDVDLRNNVHQPYHPGDVHVEHHGNLFITRMLKDLQLGHHLEYHDGDAMMAEVRADGQEKVLRIENLPHPTNLEAPRRSMQRLG